MSPDHPKLPGIEADNVVKLPLVSVPIGQMASEDSIARAFTEQFGEDLRFDHAEGKWYHWDDACWRRDNIRRAFEYARRVVRRYANGDRTLGKASAAAGVERLAQSDERHAVGQEVWDRNNLLLGTPTVTVDLATGVSRPALRADMITKQTTVSPEPGAPILFLKFLEEACGGDSSLVDFVQRYLGYCLTGLTTEHALLFIYGAGGNGKSVLINTARAVMGDYAVVVAMETLTASKYDRHPAEIACLRGARLAVASETEAGRDFAEARVKQLTGGDPVTARFMRQDPFTFVPTFKLMIVGNFPPNLRKVDDAISRRIKILDFTSKPKNPDKQLEAKLRGEHGQILSWMIEGALAWQRIGLAAPENVLKSTRDFLQSQDTLGRWLADRCDCSQGERALEAVAVLYADFCSFLKNQDEPVMPLREFGIDMKKRGYASCPARIGGRPQKVYRGIRLIS